MSNKDSQKQIYRDCRHKTGLTPLQWGHLFTLGGAGGQKEVNKKELDPGEVNSRGVNMPEALAAQLLVKLEKEGFEITKFVFDDKGVIKRFPRKKKRTKVAA